MHGYRARLGLVVPSTNATNESEFHPHLPAGVSLHTARMRLGLTNAEGLSEMEAEADACAERLGTAEVDVVAYGCTTGSLVHGAGHEEELEARLSRAAGAPAVATAASVKRAFDALGLESLAVATPYIDDLNEREAAFLEAAGYDVVEITGRGLEDPVEIGSLTPADAYRDAAAVDRPAADGVFVSCTDFRTFEVIERLEADLGKPVVTSNQATLWDALRTAGVDHEPPQLGELFRAG